ncbi:MAG: hypothetical protein LBD50_03700, partial [Rickettsiales bacterium]|nr:hypothetical protein [Rickettsiales bacterium]
MYDNGEQTRMGILERDLKGRIAELLKRHSWEYAIERKENNGEYLLVKIEKNSIIKKFALIYSQSTDKKVYQQIENEADACLINSMSFDNDNFFTKDFSKPLMLASDLLSVLKEWNQEATQTFTTDSESHELFEGGSVHIPEVSHLMAENKSEQIWMMIKALKSVEIFKKFIL